MHKQHITKSLNYSVKNFNSLLHKKASQREIIDYNKELSILLAICKIIKLILHIDFNTKKRLFSKSFTLPSGLKKPQPIHIFII